MNFTKNTGMFLVITVIVLGVFNLIAFVLPFNMNENFWTGYGFASFAILFSAIVILYAGGKPGLKSKVYGLPLIFMVWPYLIIQVVVSLLEMGIPGIPFKYELVVNAVLLAAVLIGLIGVNTGKEEMERVEAKVKDKVFFIKSLQGDVEGFVSKTNDGALQKNLRTLAEAIRFSDPMSSSQLTILENSIDSKIRALGEAVESNKDLASSLCLEIQQLLADRNRKCKLLK